MENWNTSFLMLGIVLLVLVVGGFLGGAYWSANLRKPPGNIVGPDASLKDYASGIWVTDATPPPLFGPGADTTGYFMCYVWDSFPDLGKIDVAANLSLSWPPKAGQRYRLAAYPFLSNKHGFIVVDVLRGIFELVNTYQDIGTFPGWFVSVYDADNWGKNNPLLPSDPAKSYSMRERCRTDHFFGSFKWVEVLRACYLLPGVEYPACDDGGQWYYHAPGSGVWYNLGTTLVRYNKVDAATYLMAQLAIACYENATATKDLPPMRIFRQEDATYGEIYKVGLPNEACDLSAFSGSSGKGFDAYWNVAKTQMAAYMTALQGDKDLFRIIKDVIGKPDSQKGALQGLFAYREFAGADRAQQSYMTTVAAMGVAAGGAVVAALALLGFAAGGVSLWQPLVFLSLAAGAGLTVWYALLDSMLQGLGFTTLAGALEKYGVTTAQVVDFLVEPQAEGSVAQQAFSGLSNTQELDVAIELFASVLGYDTVVMTTQPNKSGTYTVEMVDVTKISLSGDKKADPWFGGVCGTLQSESTHVSCVSTPTIARESLCPLRGGLCWAETLQSQPQLTNIYWRMDYSKAWAAPVPTSIPSGACQKDEGYSKEIASWLLTNARPCSCDASLKNDLHCVSCQQSTSGKLCAMPQ